MDIYEKWLALVQAEILPKINNSYGLALFVKFTSETYKFLVNEGIIEGKR